MKILFVDYDGVLLPGNYVRSNPENVAVRAGYNDGTRNYYEHVFDPDCVDRLNRAAAETGCKLVLVTHWKRFFDYGVALQKAIEQGVFLEYFHEDHTCPMKLSSPKSHDITLWLEDHPEVTHWLVIDDEHEVTGLREFGDHRDFVHNPEVHHVLTQYETGLTEEKLEEIKKRFEFAKRTTRETA